MEAKHNLLEHLDFIQLKQIERKGVSVEVHNFQNELLQFFRPDTIHIVNVKISLFQFNFDSKLNVLEHSYTRSKCRAITMFKHILEKCGDVLDNLRKYGVPRQWREITEVPVYTSDYSLSDLWSRLELLCWMSLLSIAEQVTFIPTMVIEKRNAMRALPPEWTATFFDVGGMIRR